MPVRRSFRPVQRIGVGVTRVVAGLAALALALSATAGAAARPGRAAPPLRVGLVLSSGLARDDFWSGGLRRAVRQLGVQGTLLVPGPREGYLPSFRSLARQGFDVVITATADTVAAVEIAAREYPRTRFAVLDVHSLPAGQPRNLWGVGFAEQEVGYLAGYLAARMEQRRSGPDVISSVGGIKVPQVDSFIAGYQADARLADPGVVTLNAYSNTFVDPVQCGTVAEGQIAKGSGVVYDVAGYCGYGALDAAKRGGIWAVGVDFDESRRGPHVLTSTIKDGQAAVLEVVRRTVAGRFAGGRVTVLGLASGAVRLGRFSPRVPPALVREIEGVRRRIVAGSISDIPTSVR
jgi:basic membrane protein A